MLVPGDMDVGNDDKIGDHSATAAIGGIGAGPGNPTVPTNHLHGALSLPENEIT